MNNEKMFAEFDKKCMGFGSMTPPLKHKAAYGVVIGRNLLKLVQDFSLCICVNL